MKPKVAAIIPARFASTRLPGKPLMDIGGKPMVVRVYEQALKAKLVDDVWVATDDERIFAAVDGFGMNVIITSPSCPSGTDRLAEAARKVDADIYVNVQGDEPMIPPELIDQTVRPLIDDPELKLSTAAKLIEEPGEIMDPSVVKVVLDKDSNALYFSRAPIPYNRDLWDDLRNVKGGACLKHIGIYVYRKDFLASYAVMEPTELESIEKLEQLRVLFNGYKIRVVVTGHDSIGVDTPADLDRVRAAISSKENA
jgi:3-deoxy-manno-octulosonate cytidylyltransferase (CMP-KDO synthetase)